MNVKVEKEKLSLQYLAGGDIVANAPIFSQNGEVLFIIRNELVLVYSCKTGELLRKLEGATTKLIGIDLELKAAETLVACSTTGEILRWNWQTGELNATLQLQLPKNEVKTFNLIDYYADAAVACAFLTTRAEGSNEALQWHICQLEHGGIVNVPCSMKLKRSTPLVAVGSGQFKAIVLAQGKSINVINYKTWQCHAYTNPYQTPITAVCLNVEQQIVATGDETGKIFLWREILYNQQPKQTLYHWHHTAVTSIAFTASGKTFYSSGHEAVLVKWSVDHLEMRQYIPRTWSVIRYVVVGGISNVNVAMCTADNGIVFLDTDNKIQNSLQEFTYIIDDKTARNKFPVGLRYNPRSNTLVLNGRTGHLQFFSPYRKRMLYNVDIVMQNPLSLEIDKILYNINVVKAAFNIDWMATVEELNDEEHAPDARLKFWKFVETTQTYALNTSVELPHEDGIRAIEFSSFEQADDLLCATVGYDNVIKVWGLEEPQRIDLSEKTWNCMALTSYKNMPIEAICFSQDASLLAAGYGSTLCIYTADTLKLKAALSSSPGRDGCLPAATVQLSTKTTAKSLKEAKLLRQRILNICWELCEKTNEKQIQELRKILTQEQESELATEGELSKQEAKQFYDKIICMHELSLYQKLLLFQRLGIQCAVQEKQRIAMIKYLRETIARAGIRKRIFQLHGKLQRISRRKRFKAKAKLESLMQHHNHYNANVVQHLVSIMSLLDLEENTQQANKSSKKPNQKQQKQTKKQQKTIKTTTNVLAEKSATQMQQHDIAPALLTHANIKKVHFGTEKQAHLVIICTESRIFIWNLLTLRLESQLSVSVKHLAFDPLTNLVAAFTQENTLYIFELKEPTPLFKREHMPNIYCAAWVPRRHKKELPLNVDWQTTSTLYFLNEQQEIMYLGTSNDADVEVPKAVIFKNPADIPGLRYATFGTLAEKVTSDKYLLEGRNNYGPLIVGRTRRAMVKAFVGMSVITMPSLNQLCNDFVMSFAPRVEAETLESKTKQKVYAVPYENGHAASSSDEEQEEDQTDNEKLNSNHHNNADVTMKSGEKSLKHKAKQTASSITHNNLIRYRKALMAKEAELERLAARQSEYTEELEVLLKQAANEKVDFDF